MGMGLVPGSELKTHLCLGALDGLEFLGIHRTIPIGIHGLGSGWRRYNYGTTSMAYLALTLTLINPALIIYNYSPSHSPSYSPQALHAAEKRSCPSWPSPSSARVPRMITCIPGCPG